MKCKRYLKVTTQLNSYEPTNYVPFWLLPLALHDFYSRLNQ
jgi:hypothetical protein